MDAREPPETSEFARTSLVLGVGGVGLCAVGFALLVWDEPVWCLEASAWALALGLLCAMSALVLGVAARRRIRASAGRLVGRGRATAGIAAGLLGLLLCAALAVAWTHGRTIRSQRNACIHLLRLIESSKDQYAVEMGRTNGWHWSSNAVAFKALASLYHRWPYPVCPLSTNAGASRTTAAMAAECYQVNPLGSNVVCRLHRHQLKWSLWCGTGGTWPVDAFTVIPATPDGDVANPK